MALQHSVSGSQRLRSSDISCPRPEGDVMRGSENSARSGRLGRFGCWKPGERRVSFRDRAMVWRSGLQVLPLAAVSNR